MVESMSVEQRERTLAMLNFDMVGRLGSELFVHGTGTAKEWESLLGSIASDLPLAFVSDGHGPSDHAAFYEAEIPVLHFFTGPHEDYHRPTDDVDKIDFDGAARVGVLALGVLERVARADTELSYVETEAKGTARGGFRISLGTMPDYAADVDGLRLAGVRKGGAAEKGGLEKGDVIVQIGEREIHGIDDYMASFAVLAPGKPVTVVILRDGEKRELVVVPAAPAR
jgi:membrane-associated protease RseP (regulator of RpoE activity)